MISPTKLREGVRQRDAVSGVSEKAIVVDGTSTLHAQAAARGSLFMVEGDFEEAQHTWGKNLDYKTEHTKLLNLMRYTRGKDRVYYATYLLQLTNATRISEAVEAMKLWANGRKLPNKFRVKTRKRGAKNPYYRLIVMPKALHKDRITAKAVKEGYTDLHSSTQAAKKWCERNLGYNTHALRDCRITWWTNVKNRPAQWIVKVTGHGKIDNILRYTEKKKVEEDFMKEMELEEEGL